MLAKRWAEDQDNEAAHQLVTSHLWLAVKIASGYRGYGLPQAEVISEANVGLMQAVKRFDPERGFLSCHVCDVVDPCGNPRIYPAPEPCETWHHLGAKEIIFQPAQGEGPYWRVGGGVICALKMSPKSPPIRVSLRMR